MTVLPKRNASKSKAATKPANTNRLEKKRLLSRALKLETLEKRELFNVDVPAFHNGMIPQDVDGDFSIGPLDVLAIVNRLNSEGGSVYLGDQERNHFDPFLDVDGDNFLTPLDALSVINFINSGEGLGEIAGIRYQVFAANPDGTPDLSRMLGQSGGASPAVIEIGVGQNIVIRTQVNDLRTGEHRGGVFAGYHELRYENVDGSTAERLELLWGEYNEIRIPTSATSGSFGLSYAATSSHPATTVTIQPVYVNNVINAAQTRAAIVNALQAAFGPNTIRMQTLPPLPAVEDGNFVFRFNFTGSRARTNIGDAVVVNNSLSNTQGPLTPTYVNDANPSPFNTRNVSPARNHDLVSRVVDELGDLVNANVRYTDGVSGNLRAPTSVRLATSQNYVLTTNNFVDFELIDDIRTIDGISISPGDRILVRAQTTASQNGVYVVTDRTVNSVTKRTLVRADDADEPGELVDAFVIVTEGTFANQTFQQKTAIVNVGFSPIVWGDSNVFMLETLGGFSPNRLQDSIAASTYVDVVDVLFRGGAAGEVRLDGQLSRVPSAGLPPGAVPGLALHGTSTYITDPSVVVLPNNVRIRILDELTAFPDFYTIQEDAPATLLNVLENDRDRENRSFSIVAGGISVLSGADRATVAVANSGSRVLFTPAPNANGEVVFTYRIRNTANFESVGTVTVNITPVNDPPIALTPTLTVAEDTAAPGLVVPPSTLFLPGPPDEVAEGQTVTLTGVANVQNGTATINSQGSLSFIPAPDFFGTATLSVTGQDNLGLSTTGVFTITVTPVNDAPIALTTSFQIAEDTSLPAVPATTLFSPGPPNESTQTVTLSIQQAPPAAQGTAAIQNNSLVFTPAPNFFGTVVFTVRGTDNGVGTPSNPTAPNPLSTDSQITVVVTPVNDPPIAVDDSLSVIAAVGVPQTLDVLDNDSPGPFEEQIDSIRVVAVTQPAAGGGVVTIGPEGANVIFTPDGTIIEGVVTFSYTIRDTGNLEDSATVTLQIVPPARPYALDDRFTIDEDSPQQTFNVLANDFVREGATAQIDSVTSIPASQGTLIVQNNLILFTPTPDFFGNVVFSYTMSDTSGLPPEEESRLTAVVTVVVREVNDPPVAVERQRTTAEDVDLFMSNLSITNGVGSEQRLSRGPNEDSQTLTITAARVVNPATGTVVLQPNGDLLFSPAPDYFGEALIEYTVTDNGTTRGQPDPLSSTSTIRINVTPVNDPPIPVNKNFTAVEDTPRNFTIASLIEGDLPGPINEQELLGQTVIFDGLPSDRTSQGGTLAIVGNSVVYTPAPDFFGVDTFLYQIRDSDTPPLSAIGTVTITVSEVNDPPVATDVSRDGIFASVRTVIDLSAELALMSRGAPNEADQTLRIVAVGPSANGVQPTIGADGTSIIYIAPLGASGLDSFSYTIEDNGTTNGQPDPQRSTATVSVNVLPFIPSSFSGRVWIDEDINRNNMIDPGELMVSGVDVYLFEGTMDNPAPQSTWRHDITDRDGYYSFNLLPPGTFTVMFVVPDMMIDSQVANFFTQTIVAPGDVNVEYNFALHGPNAALGVQLENLSSSYYLTDAGMRKDGFVAAIGADGTSLWTIARGRFDNDIFHEIVLSADARTAYITAIRENNEVYTASIGRNQFRRVIDPTTGGMLLRVLARNSELNWTKVDMAAPPVNSAAKYLRSIDEFFSTM
ncbi:Ig-like domain-containing protein [Pirellulaceae bacterium SH449]